MTVDTSTAPSVLNRPGLMETAGLRGLLQTKNSRITVLRNTALPLIVNNARPVSAIPGKAAVECTYRPSSTRIQQIVDQVPDHGWQPAIETAGGIRDGAWVADVTGMLDLSTWPTGAKVILRAERPHPGAQLTFTDTDGHRITAIITDIPDRVIAGQTAGLELNHRQHARVEDPHPRSQSGRPA